MHFNEALRSLFVVFVVLIVIMYSVHSSESLYKWGEDGDRHQLVIKINREKKIRSERAKEEKNKWKLTHEECRNFAILLLFWLSFFSVLPKWAAEFVYKMRLRRCRE